jgi:hypothetical protein
MGYMDESGMRVYLRNTFLDKKISLGEPPNIYAFSFFRPTSNLTPHALSTLP